MQTNDPARVFIVFLLNDRHIFRQGSAAGNPFGQMANSQVGTA
jgi:hypothetical protein